MTAPTLEKLAERVAALERAMAHMQSRVDQPVKKGWETTYGVFRGDFVMKEIMDAGKQVRDAEPPAWRWEL